MKSLNRTNQSGCASITLIHRNGWAKVNTRKTDDKIQNLFLTSKSAILIVGDNSSISIRLGFTRILHQKAWPRHPFLQVGQEQRLN